MKIITAILAIYIFGLNFKTIFPPSFDGKLSIKKQSREYEKLIFDRVKKHGKCLVLTEEPYHNSFTQALAGRIQENCFCYLDAPITVMGSENLPAIALNSTLEKTMLPNSEKVSKKIQEILEY